MYFLANEIVSRVGLEETVVLLFGVMLFGIFLVWTRFAPAPGPVWRMGVLIPLMVAILFIIFGWGEGTETIALLQESEALSSLQEELLYREMIAGSLRTIGMGVVTTAVLSWLVLKAPWRRERLQASQSTMSSTGARKEKDTEPV